METTEHPDFASRVPRHRTFVKDANGKSDKELLSPVKDKRPDISIKKEEKPSNENDQKDTFNNDVPTSKMPNTRTKDRDTYSSSISTIRRPVNDVKKTDITRKATHWSRTRNQESMQESTSSKLTFEQSPLADDVKASFTLKTQPLRSKIKEDESKLNISQQSNTFDTKSITKTEINQKKKNFQDKNSEPTFKTSPTAFEKKASFKLKNQQSMSKRREHKSNQNFETLLKTFEDKCTSKVKTNKPEAIVKNKTTEPNISQSPKTYVTKEISTTSIKQSKENKSEPSISQAQKFKVEKELSNVVTDKSKANIKKNESDTNTERSLTAISRYPHEHSVETKVSRPSIALANNGISRKETQQPMVKNIGKQVTPRCRPQLIKGIDACSNNVSRQKDKSETEKRLPKSTTCLSVAKQKLDNTSQLEVKTTVNKSAMSVSHSLTMKQSNSKEQNLHRKEEDLQVKENVKSLKRIKQLVASKNVENVSNITSRQMITMNRVKAFSEARTSKQSTEKGNVIKWKYKSQEFSKMINGNDEISKSIQKLSTQEENANETPPETEIRPIDTIEFEITNPDRDADKDDKECSLKDVSLEEPEASLPLLFANNASAIASGLAIKSNDKMMELKTSVNVVDDCQNDDGIENITVKRFNDEIGEDKYDNNDSQNDKNNHISRRVQDSCRQLHKVAWSHDLPNFKENKSKIEKHGNKLKNTDSVSQQSSTFQYQKQVNVIEERVKFRSQNEKVLTKYPHSKESKMIEKNGKDVLLQVDVSKPGDDYRNYSISPTVDEITGKIKRFLRPIKATGCYDNLHDYLDVHFRLLREDFVGPLREGISGFMKIMSAYKGKASTSERLKDLDIEIYENVRVLSPVVTHQGLCYKMKLKMTDNLRNVEWEVSKRLIYGSMVCLTDRNFSEFIMATVVDREVKDIKRGFFVVHFETQYVNIESLINRIFIMTETSGYFEAYRHVLSSLQTINDGDLPFEKYIVRCEKSVDYPNYMKHNTTYDLRPLTDHSIELKAIRYLIEETEVKAAACVEFSPNMDQAKDVHVTNNKDWPSKELLQMNESQYKAIKSALTREFAIIQGPPGTGKTYIGLQIVKTLLHNKSHWTRPGKASGPMLIVCFTNHALDQFLEGIVKFYKGDILRVGSRSNSEELEEFNLKTYRQIRFKNGTLLARLQYEKRDARRKMEFKSEYVQELATRLLVYQSDIVNEDAISTEIGDRLFESLTNHYKGRKNRSNFSYIVKWLGIEHMKNECMKEIRYGKSKQKAKYVKVENETSRTIKDRMIDIDEDFRFSSKKRIIKRYIRSMEIAFYVMDPNVSSRNNGKVCLDDQSQAKRFHKIFKAALMSKITDENVMSQEEADTIENVWVLNHQTKWRLYRLWIKKKCTGLYAKIEEGKAKFEAASKGYRDASLRVDKAIMEKAVVIGMTTSGAAKYQSILRKIGPKIVVVEEAAEVLEAHIITTLTKKCEHLILIGDHKQLRPNPTVYQLVVKYNFDISLFERMVKNDVDFNCLELQHRMRPEIADIMRHIYPELKDHEHVKSYPNVKGISTNLFLINHSHLEACSDEIKSYSNHKEAEYAVALCRYLLLQGYERKEITILTTYTGQLIYLRNLMPKEEFDGVYATVVDNYQGEENTIVILSLVRSNTNDKIGFLKTENRICVALSRAKVGLFIVANFDHLASHSSLWERITKDMKSKGYMGEGLALYCQNHPDDNAIVAKDSVDFQKAPEGGCSRKCLTRLECGHMCVRYCHVIDKDHAETKCLKPCSKRICDFGHKCPDRCFVECSPCSVLMPKIIPSCGHTQDVPCAIQPEEFCCQEPCRELLECGHSCKEKCGEPHTSKCYEKIIHTWPCGHSSQILCWESKSKVCPQPCSIELKCKHVCTGTCGSCYVGRVHQQCRYESYVTLLCGHKTSMICQQKPSCSKPCANRCIHGKCQKMCGELCTPCRLSCPWTCIHKRCTKRCGEICNRTPCNYPCEKILNCGHPCIGLCGEPCPNICRICNKKKFKIVTIGKKQTPSDKYVLLEQCGHLVEFRKMDGIVNRLSYSNVLRCPKCGTIIKHCLRYSNTIKSFIRTIERTKNIADKSLYSRLKSNICTITFENNEDDSATCAEIENGDMKPEVAKKKIPKLYYKVLCKTELGHRLDALHKSSLTYRQQFETVEKQWTVINEIVDVIQRIQDLENETDGSEEDNRFVSFLHELIGIIVKPRDILTNQETEDFKLEIQRGKTHLKFLKTKKLTMSVDVIAKVCGDLKTVESVLLGPSKFTSNVERHITGSIECLAKEIEVYMRQKKN